MFYYPNVLQRHTGCFATIWLAATRGSRLVKREYLKVNVVKTCEEILNYVLVRVEPPLPSLPRPRFSLYLSAQLQIGIIRVYFQQCQYLVEDIQHILERLHRAQLQIRIDMVETELIPVTVVSPEAITILEEEPIRMLQIEGEKDLPEISRRDLDLLIAEEDEAILLEERRRLGRPVREEAKEELRAPEEEIAVPPPSPLALAEVLPGRVPVPEEPKLPVWEPRAPLPEVTPPLELRLPAPPSPERRRPPGPPPPGAPPARRRRRQLLFWDKETQISREKFQEQLQTRAHCWECPKVQPPERMITSPAELFRTPTHPAPLPPELLAFWTHSAQPPPTALRRRPPKEAEEEAAAEEERRKAETPSDIEALREALEPSGPLMVSEISLEAAEEERARVSLVPPEERWAWAEVEQPEPPVLPVVPELPEVPVEMPVPLPLEPELLSLEAVHRAVALELQANREPDFSSLVPPLSPRRMAARVFYMLLVLAAQEILRVKQEKPYGRLLIQPGPRFHSG
ncbi:meiotic recombination protein REC8-like protein [Camelus ferus]|nr:meiotic recombination protein REC8-like protein [Camelus ferus]